MAYTCTVTKQIAVAGSGYPSNAARMVVEVTATTDFADKGLLVVQALPSGDAFVRVVDPYTLSTALYNVADPVSLYKRTNKIDQVVESAEVADAAILAIETGLKGLCQSMAKLAQLGTVTTVTIEA